MLENGDYNFVTDFNALAKKTRQKNDNMSIMVNKLGDMRKNYKSHADRPHTKPWKARISQNGGVTIVDKHTGQVLTKEYQQEQK